MMQRTIRTERLVLRPIEWPDIDAISAAMNNWNVVKNLTTPPYPYHRADAVDFLERLKFRNLEVFPGTYAISLGNELQGVVSIGRNVGTSQFDTHHLGYWLTERQWNKGYMSEALQAVVQEFFSSVQAHSLFSSVIEDNAASRHLQNKLGFSEVGRSQIDSRPRAKAVTIIQTCLAHADFEAYNKCRNISRTERDESS